MQVHVQGKALDIASVFYALALLHLPKLSMAQNFVHAVEAGSELKVSMQRINDFLSLPEPPAPAHLQGYQNIRMVGQHFASVLLQLAQSCNRCCCFHLMLLHCCCHLVLLQKSSCLSCYSSNRLHKSSA